MNGMRWVSGAALGLALALGVGWATQRSWQRRQCWEQATVESLFSGEIAAFESLRSLKAGAIPLLEGFLQNRAGATAEQIEQEVARLASPEEPVRRLALARLTLLPEPASELLKWHSERASTPELKERLHQLATGRSRVQKQVAGFLAGLYTENFGRLFVTRRAMLERDCRDVAAELFFAYAPFHQAWARFRDSPTDLQLRFLLLRLYTGRDQEAIQTLERFPAQEILRVAAQTWWPVELEPLAAEGGSRWATRAETTEGNVATHLLRLGVGPAGQKVGGDDWLRLERWSRWTYLFRYDRPVGGGSALVFAESEWRWQNQSRRRTPETRLEPAESTLWLPQLPGAHLVGPGRCEVVRGLPQTALLPIVRLSREEEQHFRGRVLCEWARPLVPEAIQNRVQFLPNQFPPPQVFTDTTAAPDQIRRRPKRGR
jgi:hypothetical protein